MVHTQFRWFKIRLWSSAIEERSKKAWSRLIKQWRIPCKYQSRKRWTGRVLNLFGEMTVNGSWYLKVPFDCILLSTNIARFYPSNLMKLSIFPKCLATSVILIFFYTAMKKNLSLIDSLRLIFKHSKQRKSHQTKITPLKEETDIGVSFLILDSMWLEETILQENQLMSSCGLWISKMDIGSL